MQRRGLVSYCERRRWKFSQFFDRRGSGFAQWNPLFDKLKFDMSDEELDKVNRVFNTKSGDEKDGRENQKPSVQDKGK